MATARDVALQVIRDVFGSQPRGAREALDYRLRRASLDARDRAFATELAYGAIRMRRLLDWMLEPYIGARASTLPPAIREVLRLGAYQLRVMHGVEAYAAVSQSVDLAKRYGHRGTANLVNAVLRRLTDAPPRSPDEARFASNDDRLATLASLPTWIVTHWRERFGDERLGAILAGVDATPPIGLRANLRRTTADAVATDLPVAAHVSPLARESVVLEDVYPSGELEASAAGRFGFQAEAACFPVDLLDPQPGDRVIEFCSGRGNKTLQIVGRTDDAGSVDALEIDERKIRRAREVLDAADVRSARIHPGDATTIAADLAPAPRVLLDAPCSGLGIIGRQPEARWRKDPSDSERLAAEQRALIASAASRVVPGGRLVYSVCTSDRRECEGVVASLVEETGDFVRDHIPDRYAGLRTPAGDVLVPPGIDGRDGFYIAVLRRVA